MSAPLISAYVAIARSLPGVLGARLTGAGFGGAALILVERAQAGEVARKISRRCEEETWIRSTPIVTRIAEGAR